MEDVRALANDALSEEQMRHWPACRAEGYTCGVHAEPWPCHFVRLVDAVTLLTDALDEVEAERDDLFTRASIASGDARYLRAALDRANRLIRYALHLRINGERAPGGDETWAQWDRDADDYLRAAIEGEL